MIRPGHAVLMSVLLWSCAGDTRALGDGGIDAPEETGGADAEVSEPVEDGGASDPADTSGADEQDAATATPGADVSITLDDCHSAAPESPDVGDTSPDAGAVDAADAVIGTVEPLYPTSGADWNRYVANDGADVLSASDTACAPEAAGGYMGCLHGGQMRAVSVPGHDACGELTATDALGAFTWVCDPGANPVRMVSIALREDARLSDLVDLDEVAWRDNAVTVWDGAVPVVVTPPAAWWSNPIVACPCAGPAPARM